MFRKAGVARIQIPPGPPLKMSKILLLLIPNTSLGPWSSGYDVALTWRSSGVRIPAGPPSIFVYSVSF